MSKGESVASSTPPPSVLLVILVRNKGHTLPHFLGGLDSLQHPRARTSLFVRCDHSIDDSTNLLNQWLKHVSQFYAEVNAIVDDSPKGYIGERGLNDWTEERFSTITVHREAALEFARQKGINFVFYLDSDVIVRNPSVLTKLISHRKAVIAPLLTASPSRWSLYSNFWGDFDERFYYRRSEDYVDIVRRNKIGVFQVPVVHSAFLVDVERSKELSFKSDVSNDDLISFNYNARRLNLPPWVSNEEFFGRVPFPDEVQSSLETLKDSFNQFLLDDFWDRPLPPHSNHLTLPPPPPRDTLGLDRVYIINLKRRPQRKMRMMFKMEKMGIEADVVEAVDGKMLDEEKMSELGFEVCPNYEDPFTGRGLTFGEVGCFMSHFHIWQEVVENKYEKVLILEDDVELDIGFREKLKTILSEIEEEKIIYDVLYLGRNNDHFREIEPKITEHIVEPRTSLWTLAYILSFEGAEKLLAEQPTTKLVPVDIYLPIMYDKFPYEANFPETNEHRVYEWTNEFKKRHLVAVAAEPQICRPEQKVGDDHYVTDTDPTNSAPATKSTHLLTESSSNNSETMSVSSRTVSAFVALALTTAFLGIGLHFWQTTATTTTTKTFAEEIPVDQSLPPLPPPPPPSVLLVILVRNKGHTLPHFLGGLDSLQHPRARTSLFVRCDHSVDDSANLMNEWLKKVKPFYAEVNSVVDETPKGYEGEDGLNHWTDERLSIVIQYREEALQFARQKGIDFVFYPDSDILIRSSSVLSKLMSYNKPIIAPLLRPSPMRKNLYSNFWGAINDNLFYRRSEDYVDIVRRNKVGVFQVPVVHSAFLVDVERSKELSFKSNVSKDDVICFNYNARQLNLGPWVTNEGYFGEVPWPNHKEDSLQNLKDAYDEFLLENFWDGPLPPPSIHLTPPPPPPRDTLGLDRVYIINLKRRPQRKMRMMFKMEKMGIEADVVEAFDGKMLKDKKLSDLGIKLLEDYGDPHTGRAMTYGEIGCFLSHINIWKDVAKNGYKRVLILEDDVHFEKGFRTNFERILSELREGTVTWDVLYLGRSNYYFKEEEPHITKHVVKPGPSVWAMAYVLTLEAVQKLLHEKPETKVIPVDIYLPIMFDKFPYEATFPERDNEHRVYEWTKHFKNRTLSAVAAEPKICRPEQIWYDEHHTTDTDVDEDILPSAIVSSTNKQSDQLDSAKLDSANSNSASKKEL